MLRKMEAMRTTAQKRRGVAGDDVLRKHQKEMSKAPADTTRGSGGRIDGGDEPF